jgi:hypothetical protein
MGVVNTSETCGVLELKVMSWPILNWCEVRGKVANKNSSGFIILFMSIANEGSIGST